MKKFLFFLWILVFACTEFFADEFKEIGMEEIQDFVLGEMDAEKTYTLQIKDFSPDDMDFSTISALSYFMQANRKNKIQGKLEYIYFSGFQSAKDFYAIRKKISDAKEKFVCVDISDSRYNGDFPLPQNCFSGHENLYWVYADSFLFREVPERFCADDKNLRFVFMNDWTKIPLSAFEGCGENLKIYRNSEIYGKVEAVSLKDVFKSKIYADWDYLSFTENDGDDFVSELYNEAAEELDFGIFFSAECDKISADDAEENSVFNGEDFYSVAKNFISGYISLAEKSDAEKSDNENFDSVLDLSDLEIYMNRDEVNFADENFASLMVGISGEKNGERVKDFGELHLAKENGEWQVTEFVSFILFDAMRLIDSGW